MPPTGCRTKELMRHRLTLLAGLFCAVAGAGGAAWAAAALPLVDGKPAVATVNGQPITLSAFLMQRGRPDTGRLAEGLAEPSDLELLDRLIAVQLIVQEAGTMGLSDLPDIRKQAAVTSRSILREVLMDDVAKDVTPDAAVVEQVYQDLTREWKAASLLFADEGAAKAFRDEVADGAAWEQTSAAAVAASKAKVADGQAVYHQRKEYLPEVIEAMGKLQPGEVSPVIKIPAGFVVVKVVDIRYPENAEARIQARRTALGFKQQTALVAFEDDLRAKHVVVHEDVLGAVDYEAKEPGLDALGKDTRVVATIEGAGPITVADLTEYLKLQFFHGGGDNAAQLKRMNSRKQAALDATIGRRVMNLEAVRRGLDKSDAYLDKVGAFEDSLVFDSFVQKVIAPDSKLKEGDVRGYYDGHLAQYSSPEMLRIRSLAFADRKAAEAAMAKLREGADYGWLLANSEGQVDQAAEGLLAFDGRPITTASMPEGVQKAVAGARTSEARLYESPDGRFYVLAIQGVVTPVPQAYDDVKGEIAKKLHGERLKKNVEEYAAKLKALSKLEIHLRKAE